MELRADFGAVPCVKHESASMYTATLIAQPGRLETSTLEALRDAWGGFELTWLSAGEAGEFSLRVVPENQWVVWADLQKLQIDLVVQPTVGRRKKLLLADMDSTMIQQECIDELADVAGVGDHVKAITARAMNGELDFNRALIERVRLLKGLDAGVIGTVLATRITLMPGGASLVSTMKANGAYAALVSGGFTAFTVAVAGQLGFDENRANTLVISDGKLTGDVVVPILGRAAKVHALEEISKRLGISAQDVMAVGDGANDLGMLKLAGTGAALHAKPAVAAECSVRLNFCDLSALLFIQGYGRAAFV